MMVPFFGAKAGLDKVKKNVSFGVSNAFLGAHLQNSVRFLQMHMLHSICQEKSFFCSFPVRPLSVSS